MFYSRSVLAAAAATLLLTGTSFAQTMRPPPPPPPRPFPVVEADTLSTDAVCSPTEIDGQATEILHFAKIRFVIDRGSLLPRDNRDGGRLAALPRGIPLTVIVRHDRTKIHSLLGKVLAFLRARDDVGNRGRIEILSSEYSTICGVPADDDDTPRPPKPPKH